MSQPASKVPKPPKRKNEATETDSVRTVNARVPPGIVLDSPSQSSDQVKKKSPEENEKNGEEANKKKLSEEDKKKNGDEEKKKNNFANWKEKMAASAAAGAASLNAAVVAGGENLRNRLAENSSEDEDSDSSDEEAEDYWNSTTESTTSTAPSATAIAIRNQPAVNFVTVEEEERIKAELKDAKNLRKKLRKIKKYMKKSTKAIKSFSEANESAVTALHAATDDKCTDPTIIELAAAAEKRIQEVKESNALSNLSTNITDQILEQIKPINDHAKMISVTGKERRAARDRRIRLVLGQVDVTNEEEYNKSAEIVREFEEKDRVYKDEFINFREHNSSQLGLMLRCYLLETATYLETVAKAMREAAGGSINNYYLSNDCCTKYKDFKVDSKFLSPIAPLFSHVNADREVEDRLTAKPQPQGGALRPHPPGNSEGPAVAGIPMTATQEEEQNGYGASTYTRTQDNTRVRRSIDNFLLTGQLPTSDNSRASPIVEGAPANVDTALPESENARARPTSVFDTSSTTKSLMDYIHSLADEYGIEPDFSVRRNMNSVRGAMRKEASKDSVDDDEEGHLSRPPSVVPRAKSATPSGSLILPSLHGSGRVAAPNTAPAVSAQETK